MRDHTFNLEPALETQAKLFYAQDKIKWLQRRDAQIVQKLAEISMEITLLSTVMAGNTASPADTTWVQMGLKGV